MRYQYAGGCALASANPSNQLVSTAKQLDELFHCTPGHTPNVDLTKEWLAVFTLSLEGESFIEPRVTDDGASITLQYERQGYCGGTYPKTNHFTFIYRVAAEPRALRAQQGAPPPPCQGNAP